MMNLNRAEAFFSHQLVDDPVGDDLIGNFHTQKSTRLRVQRGLPEHLGHHFAQTLEPGDLGRVPSVARFGLVRPLEDRPAIGFVECPVGLFADVDAVERRLR